MGSQYFLGSSLQASQLSCVASSVVVSADHPVRQYGQQFAEGKCIVVVDG